MKSSNYVLITVSSLVITTIFIYYLYLYAVSSPYRISSETAKNLIKDGKIDLILDVRTDLERTTLGFYPDSVHIQSSDLEKVIPINYPNKEIRILTYCNSGQRARAATEKLHALGYTNSVYIATTYLSLL
jgi:rhodanese-related sulfurtransferase